MYTIFSNEVNELIVKNSRFISLIFKIDNISDVSNIITQIKKEYPKATHYCYGYIFDDYSKCSDDGEPTNTAGLPILNVLMMENLNHVLVVVVRYFGGTLLGAGGLIRAYTKSVTEVLKLCSYKRLVAGKKISIQFPYSMEKQVNYLLSNNQSIIISKSYLDQISYVVLVSDDLLSSLSSFNYEILDSTYFEIS